MMGRARATSHSWAPLETGLLGAVCRVDAFAWDFNGKFLRAALSIEARCRNRRLAHGFERYAPRSLRSSSSIIWTLLKTW